MYQIVGKKGAVENRGVNEMHIGLKELAESDVSFRARAIEEEEEGVIICGGEWEQT